MLQSPVLLHHPEVSKHCKHCNYICSVFMYVIGTCVRVRACTYVYITYSVGTLRGAVLILQSPLLLHHTEVRCTLYMYIYIYVCVYIYICVWVCACVYIYLLLARVRGERVNPSLSLLSLVNPIMILCVAFYVQAFYSFFLHVMPVWGLLLCGLNTDRCISIIAKGSP